jgi:hypothetical protein
MEADLDGKYVDSKPYLFLRPSRSRSRIVGIAASLGHGAFLRYITPADQRIDRKISVLFQPDVIVGQSLRKARPWGCYTKLYFRAAIIDKYSLVPDVSKVLEIICCRVEILIR